jgi:spore coat protein U-like protein
MTNGSDTIAYTLYANSGRTTAVTRAAQVAANLFDGSFVANGVSHTLNVYGKIANAAAQTKPIGDYADTVTITVAFGE